MDRPVNTEFLIELGTKYKMEDLEIGGKPTTAGDINYIQINFVKKHFYHYKEQVVLQKEEKGASHETLLFKGLNRRALTEIANMLKNNGFKEI